MVYAQPRILPGKWNAQTSLGFWDNNGLLNHGQTTTPSGCQQKKRICRIGDFTVPTTHRLKLKESEKKYKYLDLVWELKKKL